MTSTTWDNDDEPTLRPTIRPAPSTDEGSATEEAAPAEEHFPPRVARSVSSKVEYGSLRFHAEGGLGEVFLARNTELNRDVALKFLKAGRAADPESRRRFLVEAEVTSRLEHPGVVPVYALGVDAEGVPCYAMRFIRGQTLHDAIDAFHKLGPATPSTTRSLALRSLLSRFVSICNTIAYAHSRGVLHRDIKPRNVMLGPYDETLVVDWGLAKRLERSDAAQPGPGEEEFLSASGATGTAPETHGIIGTPQFMSPEQAGAGPPVGPRSDVYSLGATLYVLLTNRSPFPGRSLGEVLEKVRKGDFLPPRTVTADLPRALEAICLKAMATQAGDRYPDALALAADVERWRADEPVLAWRDPWATRARRWLTRNRTRTAVAAALLIASLAFLVVFSIVQTQNNLQLQAANDRAHRARTFLTDDILGQAAPSSNPRGKKITVEEALDRASEAIGARFAGEPGLEADVRDTIGRTYQALGEFRKAEPHLLRTMAINDATLPVDDPARISARANVATLRYDQGQLEAAEALQREVLDQYRRSVGEDAPETWTALNNLAVTVQNRRRPAEAEPMMRQVLEFRTRTLGPEALETLRTMNNLGTILDELRRADEAVAIHQKVLSSRERLLPPDDPSILVSRANLASALHTQGHLPEALALTQRNEVAQARVLGEDHADRLTSLYKIGFYLKQSGRPGEAEQTWRRCLDGRRRKLGEDNLETVEVEVKVADLAWDRNAMTEVEPAYRHALKVRRQELGDSKTETLVVANNLGMLLMERGEAAEAESIFRWVVPNLRLVPKDRPQLGGALAFWAWSLVDSGHPAEAEAAAREALTLQREFLPAGHIGIAGVENLLGYSLAKLRRFTEAEALMLASYPTLVGPPASPRLARATRRIVELYQDWGKPVELQKWRETLDNLTRPANPPKP